MSVGRDKKKKKGKILKSISLKKQFSQQQTPFYSFQMCMAYYNIINFLFKEQLLNKYIICITLNKTLFCCSWYFTVTRKIRTVALIHSWLNKSQLIGSKFTSSVTHKQERIQCKYYSYCRLFVQIITYANKHTHKGVRAHLEMERCNVSRQIDSM